MPKTLDVLKRAHEKVAGVAGAVSLIIEARTVGRPQLKNWAEELREAADELESLSEKRSRKVGTKWHSDEHPTTK